MNKDLDIKILDKNNSISSRNTIETNSTFKTSSEYYIEKLEKVIDDLILCNRQRDSKFDFKETDDKYVFSELNLESIKIYNWDYEEIYELPIEAVCSLDYSRHPDGTNSALIYLKIDKLPTLLLRELILKENVIRFGLHFVNEVIQDIVSLSFCFNYAEKYESVTFNDGCVIILSDYINPIAIYGIEATKYEKID